MQIRTGISGRLWILAAKATCTTLVSSFAGGIFAICHSLYSHDGRVDVLMIINGILGGLVGVTGNQKHRKKVLYENEPISFCCSWMSHNHPGGGSGRRRCWGLFGKHYRPLTHLSQSGRRGWSHLRAWYVPVQYVFIQNLTLIQNLTRGILFYCF